MTKFKTKPLLSLLLSLVMVLTMLPMSALAAEAPETEADTIYDLQPDTVPEICPEETCTHELEAEEPTEEVPAPSEETQPETDESADTPAADPEEIPAPDVSATPDSSPLQWEIESDGTLFISGSGYVEPFNSAGDQPWQGVRQQITGVYFDEGAPLEIQSIAYWFSGCINLKYADIPEFVREIGYHAFYDCNSLHDLILCYENTTPTLVQGAFITNHPLEWETDYDPRLQIHLSPENTETMLAVVCAYDWGADGCPIHASSNFDVAMYAVRSAASAYAAGYCSYCKGTYSYTLGYEQWTDSVHCIRHWCSNCGMDQCGGVNAGSHSFSHYNSSYDRCSYCGYQVSCTHAPACTHSSTTTTWITSCRYEVYCRSCGVYLNSGTSHGPYNYGSWTHYSSSQHRRSYTCSYGDSGTYYEYGSHSTTTSYSPYSATQHSVSSYCSTCATTISTSYASHSFQYGAWENYSGTQHRRTVTCSICGYSTYEYASHSLTNGAWTSISDTQHQRTNSCSCGYSATETASHADTDGDGYCDSCGYLLTHFSVTVPASLTLTVSEHGEVYAATNAAIDNHSTGAVEITAITVSTVNGWALVPYSTNLASAKVDSKQIGFSMNSAVSSLTGTSEALSLNGGWTINSGASLPLTYDAVVSATSTILNEQVLTVVFVIDWQPK